MNKTKFLFIKLSFSPALIFRITFFLMGLLLALGISAPIVSANTPEAGQALGCHAYGSQVAPIIQGIANGGGRQITVTWTWPADTHTEAVLWECLGTSCAYHEEDSADFFRPYAADCATWPGWCPTSQGGTKTGYTCINASSATPTCTYTYTDSVIPHCCAPGSSGCGLTNCYKADHFRITYYPYLGGVVGPIDQTKCSDYGTCGTVDCNLPPSTPTLIAPPNGMSVVGIWINYNPTFTAKVTDPEGDIVKAYFNFLTVTGNPTSSSDQNGATTTSGSNSTWTPSPSLLDGKYDWRVKGIDAGGHQSSYTSYWRVKKDTLAPYATCSAPTLVGTTITISSLTGTDPTPAVKATPSGVKNGNLEESINGGATWNTVLSKTGITTTEEYATSLVSSFSKSGISPGITYSYRYYVVDGASNISTVVSCGSVILNGSPNVPNLSAPLDGTGIIDNWINYNPVFTATVSDPDPDQVKAYFDFSQVSGNPAAPADQYGSLVSSGSNSTLTLSDLADGKYDWRAMAYDSKGASSNYTGYWRVKKDTLAPVAACSAPTLSGMTTVTISSLTGTDPTPASGGTPSGVKNGILQESIDGGGTWNTVLSLVGTNNNEQYAASLASSFSKTGDRGITYLYKYSVVDGANNSNTIICGQLTVPTLLTGSCVGSNLGGLDSRWDAFILSPGLPPYTYSWSGDEGLSGVSQTIYKTYSSQGTKNARVTIHDNSGQDFTTPDCQINFSTCVSNCAAPGRICAALKGYQTCTQVQPGCYQLIPDPGYTACDPGHICKNGNCVPLPGWKETEPK